MSDQGSNRIRRIVGWGMIGLIAAIAVSIAFSFYLVPRTPGAPYYYYYPPFFPFHFGWLGGIFLVLIAFWIARWLLWPWRRGGYNYHYPYYPHQHRADAESIVRERYAKGEITIEQFDQMLRDLRKQQEG